MISRTRKLIFLTINLILFSFCASAQKLTLNEVLKSVKDKFPILLAARQELPGAQAEQLNAQGAFDPTLSLDANGNAAGYYDGKRFVTSYNQPLKDLYGSRLFSSYSISRGDYPIYDGKFDTGRGGEARAGIEVPVLRDGPIDRRRAQINRADLGVTIAESNIKQREIELTRGAAFIFYEWVAAGARRQILQDLLKTAVARTSQIKRRVKAGDLPSFDLTDNERAELQRRSQLVAAERAFQQASFELSLYRRDESGNPVMPNEAELPLKLPEPGVHDYTPIAEIEAAARARPELKRLAAQVKQNQIEVDLNKNQLLPRLDLQVGAANDFGAAPQSIDQAEAFFGVRVEIPLMVRSARGKIAAAEAKKRELESLKQFQIDRISNEVRDSLIGLDLSKQRVALASDERKAADELAKGEATRLSLGDSNLVFVNIREQTAAEAAIRQVDALVDYQRALASYKAAQGIGFE